MPLLSDRQAMSESPRINIDNQFLQIVYARLATQMTNQRQCRWFVLINTVVKHRYCCQTALLSNLSIYCCQTAVSVVKLLSNGSHCCQTY